MHADVRIQTRGGGGTATDPDGGLNWSFKITGARVVWAPIGLEKSVRGDGNVPKEKGPGVNPEEPPPGEIPFGGDRDSTIMTYGCDYNRSSGLTSPRGIRAVSINGSPAEG